MDSDNDTQAVTGDDHVDNGSPQDEDDECDLEQLAAFLEEPDTDDEDPESTAGADTKVDSTETLDHEEDDEDAQNATDKRLTSFLEELDSDDDDEGAVDVDVEQDNGQNDVPDDCDKQLAAFLAEPDSDEEEEGTGSADVEQVKGGSDVQDDGGKQLALFLHEPDSDEDETVADDDKHDVAHTSEQTEPGDDFQDEFDDEDDFDELASLIEAQDSESQSTACTGSQSDVELSTKPARSSSMTTGSSECENKDISMETNSVSMVPERDECEDDSAVSVATEEDGSDSDESLSEHNDDEKEIRAMMSSMSERMKELEAMLEKSAKKLKKKKSPKPSAPVVEKSEDRQTSCNKQKAPSLTMKMGDREHKNVSKGKTASPKPSATLVEKSEDKQTSCNKQKALSLITKMGDREHKNVSNGKTASPKPSATLVDKSEDKQTSCNKQKALSLIMKMGDKEDKHVSKGKTASPKPSVFEKSEDKQTSCNKQKAPSLTMKMGDREFKHVSKGKTASPACNYKPSDKPDTSKLHRGRTDVSSEPNVGNGIKDTSVMKSKGSKSNATKDVTNKNSSTPRVANRQRVLDSEDTNLFFDDVSTVPDAVVREEDEPAVDPKSLFGDSDDSDWDGMDEEDKRELSTQGKEIKKLMGSGPRERTAHMPTYDPDVVKKPNAWIAAEQRSFMNTEPVRKPKLLTQDAQKPQINPETGTVSGKYTLRDEYKTKPMTATALKDVEEKQIATDPFCGIRIVHPRISMAEYKCKMAGRAMIKIPRLLSKYGKQDLQKDNWVTMGVVVHRTEPRQSAAGKPFCIWKLSDLQDCDKTVTLFLFGGVYKEHWKNELGVVVGLLNPSPMDKAEKAQADMAFTIKHPQQMLIIGVAKDLGRCRATTKSGQPCSSFINKSQGEFCTYHVQAAYKKSSSRRSELQASTGNIPKAFQNKGQRKTNNDLFFYGGQSFSVRPQAKPVKGNMTLKNLQSLQGEKSRSKVTTMSLNELEPQDTKRLLKLKEKDKALLEMLSVPSTGSMNFVKHLVQKDTKKPVEDASESDQAVMQPASALDLLRDHKRKLVMETKGRQLLTSLPTLGKGFGQGKEISLDAPVKKTNLAAELAKQLAISKVKSKGGIEKEDPNAVRNKLVSPEAKEKINKRVREDIDADASPSDKETSAPAKKRSKLLGNVDLNSPEVQKLLKSKSKHKGALAEAEAEHEDKYFSQLEKREKMEDKMATVMEQATTLFYCKQCDYKHFTLHDRCKKENHPVVKVKGVKRFFKCKGCKRRSISIERYPSLACTNCGGTKFERVSLLKERSGPKLDSEQLSLRGNEQKYLGSLQQQSFLNVT